jgi:hypothetical protein
MIDFITCSSLLRARIAALLLVFSALLPAAAAQTAHTGQQNPQLAEYYARTAAEESARAAKMRQRKGHTPLDAIIAHFESTVEKDAGQVRPKANDQLVVNLPQFLSAPQFATTKLDTTPIFASAEGDFNGDGLPDIATLNRDGGINVFLNSGNGVIKFTYTDMTLPSAGRSNMVQLATGDLNGDGYADIVGLDQRNNQFVVWLSKGDGTVAAPVTYSVTPKSGATFLYGGGGIALADVTGDGHLDLVAASADFENGNPQTVVSLQVFAGKGDGTFAAPTESDTTLSDIYNMYSGDTLVLADVNGDGVMDAVVMINDGGVNGTGGSGVMTAKGDGKGGFGTLSGYGGAFVAGAATKYATSNMAVADLNKDGAPDVIFNDGSGTLWVALNQGGGSFAPGTTVLTNSSNLIFRIGDLNGDKIPDLVTFQDNMVSTYLGNGDATFSTTPHVYPGGLEPGHQQPALASYTSATNQALGAVYVSEELPMATVLTGNGDGTLQSAPILFPSSENVENINVIASGDVNGDGIADFIAFDYTNASAADNPSGLPSIISMISDGKGGIKKSVTAIPYSYFAGQNAASVTVEPMATDLNGDGKPDLLLSLGNDIEIALGNGDGTFQTPEVLNLGRGFATLDCAPGLASSAVSSQGVLEFVVAYGGDSICYGSGSQASGVFAFTSGNGQVNFAGFTQLGSTLVDAKLSDIDSDGILDLVTNDTDEVTNNLAVYVTRGIGPGTFDPNQTNTVEIGNHISGILTGDYNGDSKPDLALTDLGDGHVGDGTGGVLLLPGNNDGTFGAITRVDGGIPIEAAAWGDFNGDGYPDLALSQYLGKPTDPVRNQWKLVYNFAVMPNAGDGTFPASEAYGELSGAYIFVADYNGDGSIDAAAPEKQLGVTMFLNTMPKPSYTLSGTPASLTVAQGATGIATVTVAANSTFSGQVTLACSGAPTESTCTVNPTTVTLGSGQTASFSVVLATTAPNNNYSAKSVSEVPAWTALACVFAIFLPGRKRLGRAFPVLLALLAISTVGALAGCGSSNHVKPPLYPGTPVGATSLTITATSGALSQTFKLPVTVTASASVSNAAVSN